MTDPTKPMTTTDPTRQAGTADHPVPAKHPDPAEQAAAAKKTLAAEREARAKTDSERAKIASNTKPTPTQEENDLAALGVPVLEHEDDGSPPDPSGLQPLRQGEHQGEQHRQAEAQRPAGGYATRTATPKT